MPSRVVSGISPGFPGLSQSQGQVAHVLLTRSPLEYPRRGLSARLACVRHAASVRPEPGSNSPSMTYDEPTHPERRAGASTLRITRTPAKDRQKNQSVVFTKGIPPRDDHTTRHSHPADGDQTILASTYRHAVEFSRIGRTPRDKPAKAALRATLLMYPLRLCGSNRGTSSCLVPRGRCGNRLAAVLGAWLPPGPAAVPGVPHPGEAWANVRPP
jgi:hypothetical protein